MLKKALPEGSPPLLRLYEDEHKADCVLVLPEVSRVARFMEFERQVTASRTPSILKELYRTVNIMAARILPHDVSLKWERTRKSCANDNLVLNESQDQTIRDEYVRNLAALLGNGILQGLGYLFEPVSEKDIHRDWNDLSQKDKKAHRASRRDLLFHFACLVDVNECSLDWLPKTCDKNEYCDFLYDIIELEMPPFLYGIRSSGAKQAELPKRSPKNAR